MCRLGYGQEGDPFRRLVLPSRRRMDLQPNTLFDKSFLQSLSVDESVWFDNFFRPNVCPLFYVETLADLEKQPRSKRTPEQEVRIIADKFPEMNCTPNAYHTDIGFANLLGQAIPMTGQIILPRSRLVRTGDTFTAVVEESPEAEAFVRWQRSEFWEVERLCARTWREGLSSPHLNQVAESLRANGIDCKAVSGLEGAKGFADGLVSTTERALECVELALFLLQVPQQYHGPIIETWDRSGRLPLSRYAPYAAYVLTVHFFFQTALAANLISPLRASNQVDMAYLFYLPFCQIFVSSDKLHRNCAPLFLRNDQEFVWGAELKGGLRELNEFYAGLPEQTRDLGIMTFAACPPGEGDFFVARLWDRHVPAWRGGEEFNPADWAAVEAFVKARIKEAVNASPVQSHDVGLYSNEPEFVIKRRISKKRGPWWQVPKDLNLPRTRGTNEGE